MFALADRLGMTVENLQKSMTVDEFVYWMAYLEEMNIPWNDEYDPSLSIEDTIKIQTRNEKLLITI